MCVCGDHCLCARLTLERGGQVGKVAGNGLEGQDGGPGVRHLQLALRRGQCRRPDTGNRTDEI